MTTNTHQKRIVEQIKSDLASGDASVIALALHKCDDYPHPELVSPLIHLFATTESKQVKETVSSMLSSLKVSKTEEHFMRALRDKKLIKHQAEIISFMWNSAVLPEPYLAELTKIAVDGGFDVLFECLTLIENIEGQIPEEQWLESVSLIKSALNVEKNDAMQKLLREYLVVLQGLQKMTEQ